MNPDVVFDGYSQQYNVSFNVYDPDVFAMAIQHRSYFPVTSTFQLNKIPGVPKYLQLVPTMNSDGDSFNRLYYLVDSPCDNIK